MVTNGYNFSYPGYSEILCGFADPGIDSNAKKNNTNITVLEWLTQKPGFEKSAVAFGSWDVFPFIINETRSGIPVNAGWEKPTTGLMRVGMTCIWTPRAWDMTIRPLSRRQHRHCRCSRNHRRPDPAQRSSGT